jgi:branched-chain amino acid transport system substrate-binding protein
LRKLVENEEVLLLFGIFGTATTVAVQRYLDRHGVPHLFPLNGGTRWGDPEHFPWTMGFQPTLQTGRIIAQYLLEHRPGAKIDVFYQNDDLKGLTDGLGQRLNRLCDAPTWQAAAQWCPGCWVHERGRWRIFL